MPHLGQHEDQGSLIKDETTVTPDVDHDVPEFPLDVSVSRAEVVEEPKVKPETETLPVYSEGQVAFGLCSVLVCVYRNSLLLLHIVCHHSMQALELYILELFFLQRMF